MPEQTSMQFCREAIANMSGYSPGEQPRDRTYIKLNTNENPYPPTPRIGQVMASFTLNDMRLYPDPTATDIRQAAGRIYNFPPENIICGNGSDDLLTMGIRTFVDQGGSVACFNPSYSLYPVLARIQGAEPVQIPLEDDFAMPATDDILHQAEGSGLLFITRPNAPTGNAFPKDDVAAVCRRFDGIAWIDEAYADFADDDCLMLAREFPNVIVSRSLSKSYSLAGLRFGLAFAQKECIQQMMKVKDSYNVNTLTQRSALAALEDQAYMQANVARICATRTRVAKKLEALGFEVLPTQANFLFVKPPKDAKATLDRFRREGILLRYFDTPYTKNYIRITIGTDEEMNFLLKAAEKIMTAEGS